MKITRNDWWITPVWEVQTDFDSNFNKQLLQEIEEYHIGLTPGQFTNIWESKGPAIRELREYTRKVVDEATAEQISENYTEWRWWHNRGWVNSHATGDYIPIHGHGNPKIAMTYYVKAPRYCGDLILIDPRGGVDWDSGIGEGISGIKHKRIVPEEGKLVFFPGYLLHSVEENKSYLPRVSFTSNMSVMDPETYQSMIEMEKAKDVRKTS